MQPTWILVADGVRARLFSPIEPHTSPEDKVAERFARELNEVLERGRVNHQYERLILAAPPHFFGTLQHSLGNQVRDCVVGHLGKDLTTLPVSETQATAKSSLGGLAGRSAKSPVPEPRTSRYTLWQGLV